ncbi:hypothetical protein [Vibrio harveyi]|uniref:hypothetical protein n=1 Tax=Vibrio harveyi TaxID=669 RepID=UPI000680AE2C|nr:hypothetical protein [Vibrio harveyi]
MYRLIPIFFTSFAIAEYDVSIGWELVMEYECGVVVSESGKIERNIHSHARPVAFHLISNDATITLESYEINAIGIKQTQIFLSETPNFTNATSIDTWIDRELKLDKLDVRSEVYAWIPQEFQMMAGDNEINATWSVSCF